MFSIKILEVGQNRRKIVREWKRV